MSSRGGRWDLLGYDSDPVPADWHDVNAVAKAFGDKRDALENTWTTLDKLSRIDGWRGEAAEEFATHAQGGLESIGKARDKYGMAAKALSTYANDVDAARSVSNQALREAEEAEARRSANKTSLLTGVTEPTPEQIAAENDRLRRQKLAVHDLNSAVTKLKNALDDLEDDAKRCARGIRNASDSYKDGWFDDFKGWVRDHADLIKQIVEVLEWVAIAVAAIALLVAIVASGGALAALLAIVGAGLAAALLAAHASMMAAGVDGVSWGDIAFDLVSLASFGAGRILGKMTKVAYEGAKAGTIAQAAARAESSLAQNVKNALKISNPRNPLRIWASNQVANANAAARSGVEAALKVEPKVTARILALGKDDAVRLAQLKQLSRLSHSDDVGALISKSANLTTANVIRGAGDLSIALDDLVNKVFDPSGHSVTTPVDLMKNGVDHVVSGGLEQGHRLAWRFTVAGQ